MNILAIIGVVAVVGFFLLLVWMAGIAESINGHRLPAAKDEDEDFEQWLKRPRRPLTNERLRRIAEKNPPPQSLVRRGLH